MKRFWLVFLMMLTWISVVNAQTILNKRVDELDHRPLVIVNGKQVDALSFLALENDQFDDLKFLAPAEAMKKFGNDAGKFGAVQIKLFKTTEIITWPKLAKQFYFIPAQMPAKAKLLYGYFGGLAFNDVKLFIASVKKVQSVSISPGSWATEMPYVYIGLTDYESVKKKPAPFDKDIQAIRNIFNIESEKRVAIENAKPRIEG